MKPIKADDPYKVKLTHHTEECQCDNCGWPIYVGDIAYLADDFMVCSVACGRKLLEELPEA